MPKIFTLSSAGAGPHIDFAGELNAEQLSVVQGADGASLVLAGAGSGKTRTIIYRVAYLLRQGVPADQILLLTFTNKAAKEMLSRVEYLLGAMPTRLMGGTFHHICNLLLRRYAPAIGFNSNFSILDQEDSRDLINACIKDAGIDTKEKRFPSASVLQSFWSFARNARIPFCDVVEQKQPRLESAITKMQAVIDAYELRKKNGNAMDFDDLLVRTTDLLRTNPNLCAQISGQYRYVLVDEYQDTNRVQAEFLSLISSAHKNLLVVGDDAQSIYSFRAADVQNILSFPARFSDSKIFKLETNYRSVTPILELANESIRWNSKQFSKELKAASPAQGAKGDKPNLVAAATSEEEAQFIAEMVLKLRDEGKPLSEIAVLFRATFHSQSLEFELAKRDIPYDYRGGIRFFERAHIKDVLAYLRISANPADEVGWLRVLQLQTGIGTETAGKLFAIARGAESLGSAIAQVTAVLGEKTKSGWRDFVGTAEAMLKVGDKPAEAIRMVVKSAYGDYLDNEFPNAAERKEDLEQLAVFAEKYSSTSAFLSESALVEGFGAERTVGDGEEDGEKIVLSTIHQAKGLEWDAVFVIHLFDGAFPNARAMEEENGLEEERRLFYVACTRARQNLYLTYPLMGGPSARQGGGEAGYLHQISQFVRELPDNILERIELRRSSSLGNSGSPTVWGDDYEEDSIKLDELGDPIALSRPAGGAGKGQPPTKDNWQKKSFLGDY